MKRIEREMGFEKLSPNLVEEILHRIPFKALIRLKCVSKAWCRLINDIGFYRPNSSLGLILKFKCGSWEERDKFHEGIIFAAKGHGGELIRRCSLTFPPTNEIGELNESIASCNGLVLSATRKGSDKVYYVSSPIQRQYWLELPPVPRYKSYATEGIAFDGLQPYFKVVYCNYDGADHDSGTIDCQVFSSETWNWRKLQAPTVNLSLVHKHLKVNECWCPHFWKGAIHWIWGHLMLVYYVDKECFKLTQLPRGWEFPDYSIKRRIFWGSEGYLHHCYSGIQGIFIYAYMGDDDYDYDGSDHCNENTSRSFHWSLKHSVLLDELMIENIEVFQMELHQYNSVLQIELEVLPCAFDEDLRILFLKYLGKIISYSIETQEMNVVWCSEFNNYKDLKNFRVYPFQFN